jgi:hypothetical protein
MGRKNVAGKPPNDRFVAKGRKVVETSTGTVVHKAGDARHANKVALAMHGRYVSVDYRGRPIE